MKKIITVFLVLAISVCSLFALSACGNDGNYKEIGLSYYLPTDFVKQNIQGYDYAYTNGEAEFLISANSYEVLQSSTTQAGDYKGEWPTDVHGYVRRFCIENDIKFDNYTYDPAKNVADIKYVYDYPEVDEEGMPLQMESEYCHYVFMDNGEAIYFITYMCKVSYMEKYKPLFDEWASKLVIEKVA